MPKKESGKGKEVVFSLSHSSNGCVMYMYFWYNALLLIYVGNIFDQDFTILFLGQFMSIGFISWFACFLEYNPRVESESGIGCNLRIVQPI